MVYLLFLSTDRSAPSSPECEYTTPCLLRCPDNQYEKDEEGCYVCQCKDNDPPCRFCTCSVNFRVLRNRVNAPGCPTCGCGTDTLPGFPPMPPLDHVPLDPAIPPALIPPFDEVPPFNLPDLAPPPAPAPPPSPTPLPPPSAPPPLVLSLCQVKHISFFEVAILKNIFKDNFVSLEKYFVGMRRNKDKREFVMREIHDKNVSIRNCCLQT